MLSPDNAGFRMILSKLTSVDSSSAGMMSTLPSLQLDAGGRLHRLHGAPDISPAEIAWL